MAEESRRFQQDFHPDEGSSLSGLREVEPLLKASTAGEGDSEPFSAFESDSDGEYSAYTNYRNSHDTPDGPTDGESDTLSTPEPELTELEDTDWPRTEQPLTPEAEEERPPTEEERPPTEEEERPLTPPARVPTPDEDIPFQYPKYRDDPDVEAHVYAFQQTWESNHVSQRLTAAEAERSEMAEFGMTLEGPGAWWHAKHLP